MPHLCGMKTFAIKTILLTSIGAVLMMNGWAQEARRLSLDETILLAQQKSPSAVAAQHTLRSAYWTYRNYLATYKPSVSLIESPYYRRKFELVTQANGTTQYKYVNRMGNELTLQVSQQIPLTGGSLFIQSNLERTDQKLGNKSQHAYSTEPISIGYQQDMIGYNEMKWNRRIEPLRWQEAQKQYSETMELVAAQACNYFFALATAQTNVEIARCNLASADTLFSYAEGRYNIGTITENEMLQLRLNRLREENNLIDAEANLQSAAENLRNYLDLPTTTQLCAVTDDHLPQLEVPVAEALALALQNNPDPDNFRRSQLESRQNRAYVRANTGLKADLYLQFGLSQTGTELTDAYRRPSDMQYASVTISVPILDWGRGKGRRRVAQSNVDLADIRAEQGMKSFVQNVTQMVQQFNLQSRRVTVARQTDQTAMKRYEVARRLYILGKNTILDLNSAIAEKDSSRRNYIQSLSAYWSLYYGLRSLTGYDFALQLPISHPLP